jgi:hypothetical protein
LLKEKRKEPEKTVRSECTDCSYKQGDGYCFPCMKNYWKESTRKECGEEQKAIEKEIKSNG